MLARLRSSLDPVVRKAAKPLAVLPAWVYTVAGLAVALVYLVPCAVGNTLAASLLMLVSGALDSLDGAVARLRGEAGPRGAFIDSVSDRAADAIYALGFLLLSYPALLVLLFLASSMMVSYVRARYEAVIGKSMEGVGVMERADRILAQFIVLLIDLAVGRWASVLAYSVLVAATVATLIQRVFVALRELPQVRA